MIVNWRGDEVAKDVVNAARAAIDELTEEAAKDAATSHWWANRTGQLASEVVNEPAKMADGVPVGKFGSTMVRGFYGLFLERRTPFLRPAADRTFPGLAGRIREKLRG